MARTTHGRQKVRPARGSEADASCVRTLAVANVAIANISPTMRGLDRSPIEQAKRNLESALRALAMAPRGDAGGLCPHPLDIVAAELHNVRRYLAIAESEASARVVSVD